jgi:replicative DNA helicase
MTTPDLRELHKKLATYDGPDRVEQASVILEHERKQPKQVFYPTGLSGLDKHIKGGVYPGQLFVISGTTGHGKTTLGQTITSNMVKALLKPLWFSYEVTNEDFLEQFPEDQLPFFFMPMIMAQSHLQWVEERIIESYLKNNTKVVFIDHLHRVIDMNSKDNMSAKVGAAVIELKKMALKHGMVIFLICHTMKTNSLESELRLGDVRDSSFIEQEADTVVYVWRDKDAENRTAMKIAKNRKGGTIDSIIALRYEGGRYYEESSRPEYQGQDKGTYRGNGRRVGKGTPDDLSQRESRRYGD